MSKGPERPESVERILDATVDCVGRAGYDRASTKAIAEAAGVSKSLLHYHFASKDALLIEASARLFRELSEEVRARAAERASAGGGGPEGFIGIGRDFFDLLLAQPVRLAFVTEVFATGIHNDDLRELLDNLRDEELTLLQGTLRSVWGGELALPAERIAEVVRTCLVGLCVVGTLQQDPVRLRRILEDLAAALALGVLPGTGHELEA